MTLNDLLDQTGRAIIKQGKRNLMDPSYQRRKASSRRSKSDPINDTGRLNRSFVYTLDESINKLTFDWVYHNNPDKDYGTR